MDMVENYTAKLLQILAKSFYLEVDKVVGVWRKEIGGLVYIERGNSFGYDRKGIQNRDLLN